MSFATKRHRSTVEAAELGTSEASTVPCLMNHENYSFELEEWLNEEAELAK